MKKTLISLLVLGFMNGALADDEPADGDVKAFHPTDALLIGGNGPFNAKPDPNDTIDLEQNDQYENDGSIKGSDSKAKKYDTIDK